MSEWRGNLHPRDRRGRFRETLERLAAVGDVSFEGGSISRNRRGRYETRAEGEPVGRHHTPRAAVDRMIALGKAGPGISPVRGARLRVKDARGREIRMGDRVRWSLHRPDGTMYDMGRGEVTDHDSRFGLQVSGYHRGGLRPSDVVVEPVGKASPGAMSFTRGNVQPRNVSGERAGRLSLPEETHRTMRDRNFLYSSGLRPGDPVAVAAQALAELYRAQDAGRGAEAKRRVERTWAGLDMVSRSRARRLAQHMHEEGRTISRPRVTSVAA